MTSGRGGASSPAPPRTAACRKLAITVEPLRDLTAAQRRQLDDEVDLVGEVMAAPATLTVGTVTVGAHAQGRVPGDPLEIGHD